MKLQDQVISFHLAKKLAGLGVIRESLWVWNDEDMKNPIIHPGIHYERERYPYITKAYTASELMQMLPELLEEK